MCNYVGSSCCLIYNSIIFGKLKFTFSQNHASKCKGKCYDKEQISSKQWGAGAGQGTAGGGEEEGKPEMSRNFEVRSCNEKKNRSFFAEIGQNVQRLKCLEGQTIERGGGREME